MTNKKTASIGIRLTLYLQGFRHLLTLTVICRTERAGFEQARIANLFERLYLQQKSCDFKDLDRLERLLSSHGFLLSCDLI